MSPQKYNNFFHSCCNLRVSAFNISVQFRFTSFYFFFWSYKVKREISQGPKCTSQIWKSAVIGLRFFPLKSGDVRGAGTRDEPLRTSAWEATLWRAGNFWHINTSARLLLGFIPAALELYG